MIKGKLALGVCAVAMLGFNTEASANLVTNGNFELSSLGANKVLAGGTAGAGLGYPAVWQPRTTLTDWSSTGYNVLWDPATATNPQGPLASHPLPLWGPGTGVNNGYVAPPGGGNFVASDGAWETGPIFQTINGLKVGEKYTLSFDYAGSQQYTYDGATQDRWTASLGTQSFSTALFSVANHGFSGWHTATHEFTATSASEVLSFLSYGTPSGLPPMVLLSNVSLNEVTPAVPEPEEWAMMLIGAGLVGFQVRRKQVKVAV
jgi:hypothetical protein